MNNRIRLDRLLVQRGLAGSRERARALIMAGKVWVDGKMDDKPGHQFAAAVELTLKDNPMPFVSRGGLKLSAALDRFAVDATGCECLDVGASTGGFTDCLLQRGATRVYAVDVGYGQLAWKLRQDPRVVVIERTNIRYLPADVVPRPVDLVTIDVSFISLKIVMPVVLPYLKFDGVVLALIKPQFEVGKGRVGKGGIIRENAQHERVIRELSDFFNTLELNSLGLIPSPIRGQKGNREFMVALKRAWPGDNF